MENHIPEDRAQIKETNDALGSVLHHLRMQTALCCRSELTAPWSIEMPALENILMVHVVTEGHFWLEIDGQKPQLVKAGELTLVPHGQGHSLSSEAGIEGQDLFSLPVEKVSERYEILRHGGGGEHSRLICGVAQFNHPIAKYLLNALPPFIHVKTSESPHGAWIQNTMNLMAHEASEMRPGGETMVTLLADMLVIQAIRSWLDSPSYKTTGWLAAMQDPAIGQAMEIIHKEPEYPWTVSELAREVGRSRSGFAARFSALMEMSPIQYLTEWRMSLATNLLRENQLSMFEIAEKCGYTSEAAFSRAYKRHTGNTPRYVTKAKSMVQPINQLYVS